MRNIDTLRDSVKQFFDQNPDMAEKYRKCDYIEWVEDGRAFAGKGHVSMTIVPIMNKWNVVHNCGSGVRVYLDFMHDYQVYTKTPRGMEIDIKYFCTLEGVQNYLANYFDGDLAEIEQITTNPNSSFRLNDDVYQFPWKGEYVYITGMRKNNH